MSNTSDEIDFQIYGDDMQTVEVELDPGETVVAEAGAMNWMEEGIRFEARMGDGSAVASGFFGSLLGAGKTHLDRRVLVHDPFHERWNRQGPRGFCFALSGQNHAHSAGRVGG